jgi:general secretion pathway protein A
MYTQFFQLKQSPFSIAPDPRYLFMSERHREALAHLLYGIGSGGGFVLLTGEIGAGKTTVCRCFMEQIPDNCKLAYIFNPKLSVEELLLSICDEFGIALAPAGAGAVSVKGYVDAINGYLLASHARGVNNVLIIDEAQNLSADVLEQLRLLTNLETSERKLLQIILIGQPELRAMLARPELEQLAQRVIARYHLGSLSAEETGSYIEHRLAVAGATAVAPFPRRLMGQVHKLAKGVPRRINLLCDRALLGAYVENQPQVTRTILRRAAAEVFAGQETLGGDAGVLRGRGTGSGGRGWPKMAAGVAVGVAAGAVLSAAVAWRWMPAALTNVAGVRPAAQLAAKAPAKAGQRRRLLQRCLCRCLCRLRPSLPPRPLRTQQRRQRRPTRPSAARRCCASLRRCGVWRCRTATYARTRRAPICAVCKARAVSRTCVCWTGRPCWSCAAR